MVFGKFLQIENDNQANKCSVCFESNETRTPCSYTIWFHCWQKQNKYFSPICRGCIDYVYNEDE